MNEILRKDKMSPQTKEEAEKQLHYDCFLDISNSPALSPLTKGCNSCREKYKEIATKGAELTKPEKPAATNRFEFKSKKAGMKKFLYFRNVELERQNALLEKENEELKALVEELKPKGGKYE